jgi:hypothetical protein
MPLPFDSKLAWKTRPGTVSIKHLPAALSRGNPSRLRA